MYNSQQPQLYGLNCQQPQLHQIQQGPGNIQNSMGFAHPMGTGANNMNMSNPANALRNPGMMGAPAGLGAPNFLTNNHLYKQNTSPSFSNLGTNHNNNNTPNVSSANTTSSGQHNTFQALGNSQYPSSAISDSLGLDSLNLSSSINSSLQTSADGNDSQKDSENSFENDSNTPPSSSNTSDQKDHEDTKSNTQSISNIQFPDDSSIAENLSSAALATRQTSDDDQVYTWIHRLMHGPDSEQALLELGKKREQYDDLALILWHSFGVMTCLLQEIIYVYPLLSPPQLTSTASNRVCNALALLQCIASHDDTRQLFLNAHIPLYLYPFLNTTSKSRSFEYLRLTSLGVIGALVKNDSPDVINFLLTTEIIPLCLRIMESGTELSKTVAIFILQKILMDDEGLKYICQTYERFMAVSNVLSNIVEQLVGSPTARLLKHVVRCYLRLSDNERACHELKSILPEPLRDGTFSRVLKDDLATKRCLVQLLRNLSDNNDPQQFQQM